MSQRPNYEKEIISQYKVSLKMVEDTIKRCPEDLWKNNEYENPYWRIVYHTLFYASLYLDPDIFTPLKKHKANYNRLGSVTEDNKLIIIENIYSKMEILAYQESIYDNCESLVENTIMNDKSDFDWMPPRAELHLYNIRHI